MVRIPRAAVFGMEFVMKATRNRTTVYRAVGDCLDILSSRLDESPAVDLADNINESVLYLSYMADVFHQLADSPSQRKKLFSTLAEEADDLVEEVAVEFKTG